MAALVKKLFSYLWPPYFQALRRREAHDFFSALIDTLPSQFDHLRDQLRVARFWGIAEWPTKPDLMFIDQSYPGRTIEDLRKRGENVCISGLRVYSNKSRCFEAVELILRDNLLTGFRVSNLNYEIGEFDLNRIENSEIRVEPYDFEPDELEVFYDSLDPEVRRRLKLEDMFEVQPNNRTYFAFYDLEDGNYLATDKKQKVYSLIHDARPMVKRLNQSLLEILLEIEDGSFDKEEHLEDRYSKSR